MKRPLIALAAIAALTGLASISELDPPEATQAQVFQVQGNWSELKRGRNILKLHVSDPQGAAVTGARLELSYDMPEMPMNPPVEPFEAKDGGNYETRVLLGMRGTYQFQISISAGAQGDRLIRNQLIQK
ncbi:MAG: FixH family protein [Oligoflexia bacterium]|nr:FixH family protein [Oligoflexia bacterium]